MIYKVCTNIIVLIMVVLIINYIIYNMVIMWNSYQLFECGFDMIYWIHPKLSIHFFKIGIIFILFDLELMLLILCFINFLILIWMLMMFIHLSIFMEFYLEGFKWVM